MMPKPNAIEKMENLGKRCKKRSSQDAHISETKINEWKLITESYYPHKIKSDWNTLLHLSHAAPAGRILLKSFYFSDERV